MASDLGYYRLSAWKQSQTRLRNKWARTLALQTADDQRLTDYFAGQIQLLNNQREKWMREYPKLKFPPPMNFDEELARAEEKRMAVLRYVYPED
jgi:hypothetical protein